MSCASMRVKAEHPSDLTQTAEVTGTLEHLENKGVTIELPAIGRVKAIVKYPKTTLPGVVLVTMQGEVSKSANTVAATGEAKPEGIAVVDQAADRVTLLLVRDGATDARAEFLRVAIPR